ncbi:mediator of RNA polymerase II transcription subunit 1-like [Anneissia japonica]|uniref:mediator of RNA polymerase II transcription subunit 1-like n=1 Tax=Anneissia japonica TaxID=1529436 RepID=UPI0014256B54|nr:mediator of RNA polymerase II transcription subunit 1-like [Anneissia japonica]
MSLPTMVERLKSQAIQAGLKFHTNQNAREVFISSDVFYVEVLLESSGIVEDVKIYRQDEPVSCHEMRDCLSQSNFKGFLEHLKGLNNFYQLPCEVSVKRDAFKCLQTLEDDLKEIFNISCLTTSNVMMLILKGLVGFVTPRIGGYPMRLTFFVSPYDLLNVEKKTSTILNMSVNNSDPVDVIYKKAFGTVPHESLKTKLKANGITGRVLIWISNFLSSRQQSVSVKGHLSSRQEETSGVIQGSVIGPILFLIFVNNLLDGINSSGKLMTPRSTDEFLPLPMMTYSKKA